MTDREKVEKLAGWMGYETKGDWSDDHGLHLLSPNRRSYSRWWHPLTIRDDAMDLFEQLTKGGHDPVLRSCQSPASHIVYWLDHEQWNGARASTIPEAITTAVLAWIGELNDRRHGPRPERALVERRGADTPGVLRAVACARAATGGDRCRR